MIVADDLTGALDSAVPFAARGLNVRVVLDHEALVDAAAASPNVLAINTRSRNVPAHLAAEGVVQAWGVVAPLSPWLVMKKVDSRLQGSCRAEVAALLALSGRSAILACPAVPDQQRVVHNGQAQGRGMISSVNVAQIFAGLPCYCPNAITNADLDALAAAILDDAANTLAVGAYGLAAALAKALPGRADACSSTRPELPLLIAIGSMDGITAHQVERLLVSYPAINGVDHRDPVSAPIQLMQMPRGGQVGSDSTLAQFARDTASRANAIGARTLLCSGGDTAAAVMDALGTRQLIPERELFPGIPIASLPGRPGLRLITKSGGFGDADVLIRIVTQAYGDAAGNAE